jgi:hypothetical protein
VARVPLFKPEPVEEPFKGITNPAEAEVAYCSVLVTVSCESENGRDTEANTAGEVADVAWFNRVSSCVLLWGEHHHRQERQMQP